MIRVPTIERVMARVEFVPWTGCWIWLGACDPKGYGNVYEPDALGLTDKVHRVVYAAFRGAIPRGKHLDHTCRVTCCCNPWHMLVVSNWRNQKLKKYARRRRQ